MLICILHDFCIISQLAPPMLLTLVLNSSCTVMTWSMISWAFRFRANPPLPVAQKVHLIGHPTCHAQSHNQTSRTSQAHVVAKIFSSLNTATNYKFRYRGTLIQLLLQSTTAFYMLAVPTAMPTSAHKTSINSSWVQASHPAAQAQAQMHRCRAATELSVT